MQAEVLCDTVTSNAMLGDGLHQYGVELLLWASPPVRCETWQKTRGSDAQAASCHLSWSALSSSSAAWPGAVGWPSAEQQTAVQQACRNFYGLLLRKRHVFCGGIYVPPRREQCIAMGTAFGVLSLKPCTEIIPVSNPTCLSAWAHACSQSVNTRDKILH